MNEISLADKMMDPVVGVVTPPDKVAERLRISDKLA